MSIYIPDILKNLLPEELITECHSRTFNKGDHLFNQGKKPDYMYFIVSGEVILTRANQHGEPITLQRCKGGFVSEASLLTDVYHCDAFATHSGIAITLPIQSLRNALLNSDFSLKWVQLLSKEIMRLRTQSERLGLKDIKSKLIHLIETDGKAGTLHLQSDLKSMASEIGVTHEALYRALAALEKEGLLVRHEDALELLRNSHPR
jgi:CRP-like cAMP-binding protein